MPTNSVPRLTDRSRRRLLLPIAAIAAIAAGSVIGCGSDSSKSSGSVEPAKLVPASASAYLAVSVRPAGEAKDDAQA